MMSARIFFLSLFLSQIFPSCKSQKTVGTELLLFQKAVAMPGVTGRIDHMDVNLKDKVIYVAALGNNSLEVVDITNGKVVHSIRGLDEPQGVAYIPQHDEVIVANGGNGECDFFNAKTFSKVASVQLGSDADDVRYDSSESKVYIGYGEGGIAVIDANTHKKIDDIKLPAHPEGFQLDKSFHLLYINVPDAHLIEVVDLLQSKIIREWKTGDFHSNFPMAIDPVHHRVFVGYRSPAKFVVLDGKTGNLITNTPFVGDADDLYFDPATEEIYASGGDGYINVFKKQNDNSYQKIVNIPSRNGARTSLLIPELKLFVLAARAGGEKDAELQVYKTN